MASRPVHQTIGYDFHVEAQSINPLPLPPPPPRDTTNYPSPRRHDHGLNPPQLTTSVPSVQGGSYNSTPLSAISHQSPFATTFNSSPVVVSATTPVGASPMVSRMSGHFSVPYDPRDWAPGTDRRANQALRARESAAENGLASPPPPYSPANEQRSSTNQMSSSQQVSSPPAVQTPPSATPNVQQRNVLASQAPPNNRHSIHMGYYVPPPPSGGPSTTGGTAPAPRARVASDMHNGYYSRDASSDPGVQPPNARRAASANARASSSTEAGPSSRSSSRQREWTPGMPLPGPPPGPPPATSRSQSSSAALDRQAAPTSRPRPLRQTIHLNELGPVPPTPANWTEEQPMPNNTHMPLHIDTTNINGHSRVDRGTGFARYESSSHSSVPAANINQNDSSNSTVGAGTNLSRSSALRDGSAKGIRERRSQNRNSILLSADAGALSVQTSQWNNGTDHPESHDSRLETPPGSGGRPTRLRPKVISPLVASMVAQDQITESPVQLMSTPPISPAPVQPSQPDGPKSAGLPPKALPTPPLSHKAPLSAQSMLPPSRDSFPGTSAEDSNTFLHEATQRHAQFLEKEKQASSDAARLQLFAEYLLHEASIRQSKYDAAFRSGDFDVENLRQNIFKSSVHLNDPPATARPVSVQSVENTPKSASSNQSRPETMWWRDYQPALSPIASMDHDEMSSRGRAPSRWWESQTGSQSGGVGPRKIQRSKRESKYMGLSKEFLMAHSPSEEYPEMFNRRDTIIQDNSSYPVEKANPETFGYFDDEPPRRVSMTQTKAPESPALLDISRFITLPPPYPRHFPAVNNNHPNLAQYRTTVRTLSDFEEVKTRRSRHQISAEALQSEHKRRLSDSRRQFRSNVQAQIEEGSISFAEAAEAEEAFKMTEFDMAKKCLQSEFDTLQDVVINPLHDMLHERITQLDSSIQQLQDDLHKEARYQDPDRPQEEGDETPELLEKLTQLKWLFDVREQIHRECFELLSERNDKYKSIVLLPYQYSNNIDKTRDTETFFNKDTHNRYIAFCNDSLRRNENLLRTIEHHVGRGVELQSSAFWDIAPGLLDLLQKIPDDLRYIPGIKIPEEEYSENPSYHRHPQQYLYLLLTHAEKSTYQFIEGQVNLQCLLHEVKTGLLSSKYRELQAHDGGISHENETLTEAQRGEEAALTAELKQKASMIEEQWLEALGSRLQATRERVKSLLQDEDAWEEVASEDA